MSNCQGCGSALPPNKAPGQTRKWCTDRCRKQTMYHGVCVDCGTWTNGYDGPGTAPERCGSCSALHARKLTRAGIIEAIQTWADEHGGVPPCATDWNPQHARAVGFNDRAAIFDAAEGRWPYVALVQDNFGSWNAGIEAAGFEPRRPGEYGREGEDPEVVAETAHLYRDGLTWREIAEAQGINESGVGHRLRKAGVELNRPKGRRAA